MYTGFLAGPISIFCVLAENVLSLEKKKKTNAIYYILLGLDILWTFFSGVCFLVSCNVFFHGGGGPANKQTLPLDARYTLRHGKNYILKYDQHCFFSHVK